MRDSAMPWRSRRMVLSSAGALRRNLSRAGVLKKRSWVSTAVAASAATSRRGCRHSPPAPEEGAGRAAARTGAYFEAAHRADGGQRLAPEAQGGDGVQIGLVGDLRGGVALEREVEIGGAHAHPVIAHPDELTARILE